MSEARPARLYDYVTDPAEIYRRSFAQVRAEADLSGLPEDARTVAVRMIHASGDLDLPRSLALHPRLVSAARGALEGGATIFTDAYMIASGVTRRRLPADNAVRCLLDDPRVPERARAWERGVDELAAEDSEVAEYVTSLEQQQDATDLPEASGEVIAAEFERYLRRRQGH